jgi:hypothetical protein
MPAKEVQLQGNEGQTFLVGLLREFEYFPPLGEELSHTNRIMIENISLFEGIGVHVVQEKLTVVYAGVAVLKIDLPRADRFDLRSFQNDTDFQRLEYMVFVPRAAVDHDYFDCFLRG